MDKILAIARSEYLQAVRSKAFLAGVFLGAAFVAPAVFGAARLAGALAVDPVLAFGAALGFAAGVALALGAALGFAVIDKLRLYLLARGIKQAELSWVLEDNAPMRNMIELLGARPSKIYRVYEKALA